MKGLTRAGSGENSSEEWPTLSRIKRERVGHPLSRIGCAIRLERSVIVSFYPHNHFLEDIHIPESVDAETEDIARFVDDQPSE